MADFQKLASNPLKIRLEDIKLATNNFAEDNLIGHGGFGRVYKGQLKSSSGEPDTDVAVKMLDGKFGQGQHEFGNEILLLANYKHNNIVSLLGFCDEEGKKALIYKNEVHGSLDRHLANKDLTWEQRLQICLGAAHGLEYLHGSEGTRGHRVIHRDIKSSNILLDANWEAKISDFGLAKLGLRGQEISVMYTNAAGTLGYLDPQYRETDILSKESDVFSFGVVMFEVLCGRLAMLTKYNGDDVPNILYRLAKLRYDEGKLDEIVIPDLIRQSKKTAYDKFSKVAYECLNEDRKQRPTMSYVVQELEAALELQIGHIVQTELWGSIKGGYPWMFLLNKNQKLRKIIIDHKEWIYSVTFVAEDINGSLVTSQRYGGAMGTSNHKLSEIILDVDEEVTGICGTVGTCIWDNKPILVISSLYFKTNKNNYGVYGEPKNVKSEFSKSWGVGLLAGFHGRSGTYLDAFGCCLYKDRKQRPAMSYVVQELKATSMLQIGHIVQTELWGSIKGGYPWSFLLKNNQKIRKIIIDHKEWIYSVTFVAEDINGLVDTQQYGGAMGTSNHKLSQIILDVGEEVTGISGTVGTCIWDNKPILVISSLYFKTNKNNYGVYGEPKNVKSEFSKSWGVGSLAGFHGRSGTYLDAFGCWLKN